jgi:hypothetical protein
MGERLARFSEPGEGAEKFGDAGSPSPQSSPQRGAGAVAKQMVKPS